MLDAPVDVWYRWLGVAAASLAVLGVAVGLPTGAAPDATVAATTVEGVAASTHPALAECPLSADAVRLGRETVSLRTGHRTATASLAYRVTPVRSDTALAAVLAGTPPSRAFDSPAAFARALATARDRRPDWRPAGDRLLARHVSWEGVDATLVGA